MALPFSILLASDAPIEAKYSLKEVDETCGSEILTPLLFRAEILSLTFR